MWMGLGHGHRGLLLGKPSRSQDVAEEQVLGEAGTGRGLLSLGSAAQRLGAHACGCCLGARFPRRSQN